MELDNDVIEVSLDEYEEILNECYPPVVINGQEFFAGSILRRMSTDAFIEGYWQFLNDYDYAEC
jgi:hypothetical protein